MLEAGMSSFTARFQLDAWVDGYIILRREDRRENRFGKVFGPRLFFEIFVRCLDVNIL